MRKLVYLAAFAALAVALQTGGDFADGVERRRRRRTPLTQREADLYQIDQIEVKFHRATSHARHQPDDVALGAGRRLQHRQQTLTGKAQIRHWFADREQGVLAANPHWESDTPSYKIKVDRERRQGDALLRVPLHRHEDGEGHDGGRRRPHTCRRSTGKWLIIDSAGSTATSAPVTRAMAQPEALEAPPAPRRWAALVRLRATGSCGRSHVAPASVRTKLLVAFLAIAALLVARRRARAALARPGERARRGARHAAARSATYQTTRSARGGAAADPRRARPRATSTLTPYTGGETLPDSGRQLDARRRADPRCAVPDRTGRRPVDGDLRVRATAGRRAHAAADPGSTTDDLAAS